MDQMGAMQSDTAAWLFSQFTISYFRFPGGRMEIYNGFEK